MPHIPASASLRELLKPFQSPTLWRSIVELLLTIAPLAILWTAGAFAAMTGLWWLALLISIPAAAFVVRLFMIQHDCGHRSFFKSAWANDWVGRVIGVVTLTPHDCWRRTHSLHHATSGNL
ncbi:MAG: fatty acid desaturase, partial [Alphaproteobacteria bacterium]